MSTASTLHELTTLVRSYHSLIVIESAEEERARHLVGAAANSLGISYFEWSVAQGLQFASGRETGGRGIANTHEASGVLRHLLTLQREGIFLLKDFAAHLDDPVVRRLLREVCQTFARTRSAVVVTGTAIELSPELESHAAYLTLELPTSEELRRTVAKLGESLLQHSDVRFRLERDDMDKLVDALRGLTLNQARQTVAFAALEDGELNAADIGSVVDRKARLIQDSGVLEYFPAADNAFELGGFANLAAWLARAEQGFTEKAAALNLSPPRGVLLAGVQGCGKSLAAKSIARRWRQPLLKLDAGRLYNRYVGESERNLRRALALAEAMAPTVLWIDEIEKAFGSGDEGMDGGLSRRVQGHLLTWLQERSEPVFVVATANDVFSLPPELIRRGRFDEIFFVDLPKPTERETIFDIHLRLRRQNPADFDRGELVAASDGMSGAEIEQAIVASLYRALHEEKHLSTAMLLQELLATVPLSTSRREDVSRLRQLAERFTPVS
jgi:hypothetical protein